jgi:peptidoglycan/xylan/chitin deacetylase (PgdA/CDA1 family)
MIRMRCMTWAQAGQIVNMSWDNLGIYPDCTPAVLMSFDDGVPSQYVEAFGYMRQYRMRGTIYPNGNLGGGITVPQLVEMASAGWTVGHHTRTHNNMSLQTGATGDRARPGHCRPDRMGVDPGDRPYVLPIWWVERRHNHGHDSQGAENRAGAPDVRARLANAIFTYRRRSGIV